MIAFASIFTFSGIRIGFKSKMVGPSTFGKLASLRSPMSLLSSNTSIASLSRTESKVVAIFAPVQKYKFIYPKSVNRLFDAEQSNLVIDFIICNGQ